MSKSKEEKKRKRDEVAIGTVSKKLKKSKQSESSSDGPVVAAAAAVEAKRKKNAKKDKDEDNSKDDADISALNDALVNDRADKKKEKKEKKEKKAKKSKKLKTAGDNEANLMVEMKTSEDFISINDDEPVAGIAEDVEIDEIVVSENDKARKKEKEKKGKSNEDKTDEKENVKLDKLSSEEKRSKKAKKTKDLGTAQVITSSVNDNKMTPNDEGVASEDIAADFIPLESDVKSAPTKEKKLLKEKKKKAKKSAIESNGESPSEEQSEQVEPAAEPTDEASATAQEGDKADGAASTDPERNKGRFIVFVGNLPYTATKQQIDEHFAKIKPSEIRLRTYKGTNKFMGTCFVEFDRFDRMETCLKKYHHSLFPDGKKNSEGRKINVELSAGGGGNSDIRKSKIIAKNDKLHDERARDREKRVELEMKQSARKEKKELRQKKAGKAEDSEDAAEAENGGMHPARLAMMSQPARPTHRQRY